LRWVLQDKVQADASRVTSTFTCIDAAHRGVILGKVQNYFDRIRLGHPTVNFIARPCRLGSG
jgi:hypothetical protein